ncbi:MAG: hypothetical protein AAGB05_01655 [Pseudomonadota bacterium]
MFRPVRLVMMILSASLALGFFGLRVAAPAPGVVGLSNNGIPDAALRLYGSLYAWANDAPMPDFQGLFDTSFFGDGPRAPEVGTPGFSDSQMGRSLADLRERQTGVPSGPVGLADVATKIQTEMNSQFRDFGAGSGRPPGPPPAQPRRLIVSE